ncbi:MAG: hypothetical protein AAGI52_03555 [Bacteroidota bacterium]
MFKPSSLLLAAVALVAASSLAFTPGGDAAEQSAKSTHTLTIDYQEQRRDFRRAMLKIAPNDREVRPLWRGPLHSISVLTTDNRWIIIESWLSSGHSTGHSAEARAMLPAPEAIAAIMVRPERGGPIVWEMEPEGYTKVEWTYFTQNGEETDPPAPKDDTDTPDEEEPDTPDEPKEDEGCSGTSCSGIIDPWTCECQEDIRDPWGEEVRDTQVVVMI